MRITIIQISDTKEKNVTSLKKLSLLRGNTPLFVSNEKNNLNRSDIQGTQDEVLTYQDAENVTFVVTDLPVGVALITDWIEMILYPGWMEGDKLFRI